MQHPVRFASLDLYPSLLADLDCPLGNSRGDSGSPRNRALLLSSNLPEQSGLLSDHALLVSPAQIRKQLKPFSKR